MKNSSKFLRIFFIIDIVAIIIAAFSFHFYFDDSIFPKIFPKEHLTLKNTYIDNDDINRMILQYKEADYLGKMSLRNDPLFKTFEEHGLIVWNSENSINNKTFNSEYQIEPQEEEVDKKTTSKDDMYLPSSINDYITYVGFTLERYVNPKKDIVFDTCYNDTIKIIKIAIDSIQFNKKIIDYISLANQTTKTFEYCQFKFLEKKVYFDIDENEAVYENDHYFFINDSLHYCRIINFKKYSDGDSTCELFKGKRLD